MPHTNSEMFEGCRWTDPAIVMSILRTPFASVLIAGSLLVYIINTLMVPFLDSIKDVPVAMREMTVELRSANKQLDLLLSGQENIAFEIRTQKSQNK